MQVIGSHLERVPALIGRLEALECDSHDEVPEVHLIVAEDGSVQFALNVGCCEEFRSIVRRVIRSR